MKPVQRLEIIVERSIRDKILDVLTHAGCHGWSILPVSSGHGHRGTRGLEGLPGGLENELILAAVDDGQLPAVLDQLRPLLERWGGVCMVSQALWLRHEKTQDSRTNANQGAVS